MLAVSSVAAPLRDVHHGSCQQVGKVEGNDYYADEAAAAAEEDQFIPDFSDGNSSLLLESIDFDDLFAVGDVLPDLEILADFSAVDDSEIHGGTSTTTTTTTTTPPLDDFVIVVDDDGCEQYSSSKKSCKRPREEEEVSGSGGEDSGGSASPSSSVVLNPPAPASKSVRREGEKGGRKSTTAPFTSSTQGISSKGNLGKRKVKVDWTPELHRRFVQAVEQLGVDKAVPSRILELMGIDCLTRHNVASHLQKYRSHRKHVLAREAEAATWTQRRQVYGGGGGGAGGKRDVMVNGHQKQAWHAPMMGFPPPAATPPPVPQLHHLVRPLHVWGHPSMDQSLIHMWPKHLPPPPPHHHHHPSWTHPPPPPAAVDPLYWHHQRVPAAAAGAGVGLTPGTPCFPQQVLPPTRFPATPVAGILPPSHSMYKAESAGIGGQLQQRPPQPGSGPNHLFDVQPSKESIDAAIGDVLSKPWLPLPLGLKPPAVDSVLVELQRQGIPNVPPAAAASSSSS